MASASILARAISAATQRWVIAAQTPGVEIMWQTRAQQEAQAAPARLRRSHAALAAERAKAQPQVGYVERISTPKNSFRYKGLGVDGRMLKVWVFPDGTPESDKVVKTVAWEGEDDGHVHPP